MLCFEAEVYQFSPYSMFILMIDPWVLRSLDFYKEGHAKVTMHIWKICWGIASWNQAIKNK